MRSSPSLWGREGGGMWRLSLPYIFPSGRLGCLSFEISAHLLPAAPVDTRQLTNQPNHAWGAKLQPRHRRCCRERDAAAATLSCILYAIVNHFF